MEGASVGCVPIGGRTGQLLDDARTVSAEEDVALLVILKGGVVGQHLHLDFLFDLLGDAAVHEALVLLHLVLDVHDLDDVFFVLLVRLRVESHDLLSLCLRPVLGEHSLLAKRVSIALVVGSRDQPLVLLDAAVARVLFFDVLVAGGTRVLVIAHRHGGIDGATSVLQLLGRVAEIEVSGVLLTGGRGVEIDDRDILRGDLRVVVKGIASRALGVEVHLSELRLDSALHLLRQHEYFRRLIHVLVDPPALVLYIATLSEPSILVFAPTFGVDVIIVVLLAHRNIVQPFEFLSVLALLLLLQALLCVESFLVYLVVQRAQKVMIVLILLGLWQRCLLLAFIRVEEIFVLVFILGLVA